MRGLTLLFLLLGIMLGTSVTQDRSPPFDSGIEIRLSRLKSFGLALPWLQYLDSLPSQMGYHRRALQYGICW